MATIKTRLSNLKTWAKSQFAADPFCVLGIVGDALVLAVRLPLAVIVIVGLGK